MHFENTCTSFLSINFQERVQLNMLQKSVRDGQFCFGISVIHYIRQFSTCNSHGEWNSLNSLFIISMFAITMFYCIKFHVFKLIIDYNITCITSRLYSAMIIFTLTTSDNRLLKDLKTSRTFARHWKICTKWWKGHLEKKFI